MIFSRGDEGRSNNGEMSGLNSRIQRKRVNNGESRETEVEAYSEDEERLIVGAGLKQGEPEKIAVSFFFFFLSRLVKNKNIFKLNFFIFNIYL